MKKLNDNTSMICVEVGDLVDYEDKPNEHGKVVAIKLVPNSPGSTLVALLRVRFLTSYITATSNNFKPVKGEMYEECYPSLIKDQI